MIMNLLSTMSARVDIIFDAYWTPSIKDSEHTRRGREDVAYSVTGPDQKRPSNWQQALRASSFTTAFLRFLKEDWKNQSHAAQIANRVIYLAIDTKCYKYYVIGGKLLHEEASDYHCTHEEADTRLIFHIARSVEVDPARLKYSVRSNDTDVLVLLLYHVRLLTGPPAVWMDVGLSGMNTRRYINITDSLREMDPGLVKALPGLHAFTGCDFTASFMNKGKLRPFEIVQRTSKYKEAFSKLGEDLSSEVIALLEAFVCALYSRRKFTHVNEVRLDMFLHYYAPKTHTNNGPLDKIKGINPSSMPPCQQVLLNKIKRSHYVAEVWKRASTESPASESPVGRGWEREGNMYYIKWFDGNQVPPSLSQILRVDIQEEREDEDLEEVLMYDSDDYDSDDEFTLNDAVSNQ